MIGLLLAARLALGQPLTIPAPPGATAEVLPLVEAGRVEILVRNGSAEGLAELFEGRPPDGTRAGRVTDFGGHFVLTVWLKRTSDTLELERQDDAWVARTARWSMPAPRVPVDVCSSEPDAPLWPLHGADMLEVLPREALLPTVPKWKAGEPPVINWANVNVERALVYGENPSPDKARHLYTLGALHRELGHEREAAHYFLLAMKAGAPTGIVGLQRAAALLRLDDWEGARQALDAAIGAPEDARLRVEGAIALHTGTPGARSTGRALARAATDTDSALIAGALLMRATCWKEAEAVLAPYETDSDPSSAMGVLLLSDARLLSGDSAGAQDALTALEHTEHLGPFAGLVRARARLVGTARETPALWAADLPDLGVAARSGDAPEALEALFLHGQIAERLGDPDEAIRAWATLIDRRRSLVDGEPGERLALVWQRQVAELLANGRDVDALVAHHAAWRPGLERQLKDLSALLGIARASSRLGLHESALEVLALVAALQGERGLDDRETVLAITDAYLRTGRYTEALDSLDFLSGRGVEDARIPLLRGVVLASRGNAAAARAAWGLLTGGVRKSLPGLTTERVNEARLRLAMSEAEEGRCASLLELPGPASTPDDLPAAWVAALRSRCLARERRDADARAEAGIAAARFADPVSASWARGLAGAAGGEDDDGIWGRLAAEDAADAALRARISALGGR